MIRFHFKLFFSLIFLTNSFFTFPAISGMGDDDGGDGGGVAEAFAGSPVMLVPIFLPDGDQHRGRGLVQLPPIGMPAMPMAAAQMPMQIGQTQIDIDQYDQSDLIDFDDDQDQMAEIEYESDDDSGSGSDSESDSDSDSDCECDFDNDDEEEQGPAQFPHRRKEPKTDEKYGRSVITLDGGSPENPYQICDRGTFYVGALIGLGIVEPHSYVQFNAMSKLKFTKSNSAHRRAENYKEATKRKWAKYPKKVEDFDKWENGDWIRRHGMFSIGFYAGVSYFAPDVRVGVNTDVVNAIHYQKVGPDLIRVSITKEIGGGPVLRAQAAPFQKGEIKDAGNYEKARVYLFDLTKENERKALDDLVQRNVLFAGSEAQHATKHSDATQLTSRTIKRHKTTITPVQSGIPFIARARKTWSIDRFKTAVTTRRGDIKYKFTAKAHYKNSSYRHKNFKKNCGSHKSKQWRNFTDKHNNYNQGFLGGVIKTPKKKEGNELEQQVNRDGQVEFVHHLDQKPVVKELPRNRPYIQMQHSFNNDRVQAKKVNHYIKKIFKKVGVNDHMVDLGYKGNAMIGYAELRWSLRVGPRAIDHVVQAAIQDKKLFKHTANDLIDDYFGDRDDEYKSDPHGICRGKTMGKNLCIKMLRRETQNTLSDISQLLRKLNKKEYKKSSTKMAEVLADISKNLSTNQFVLNTFLMHLPENLDGYGRMQIFGERFLGTEFVTDPGRDLKETNSFTAPWLVNPEQDDEDDDQEIAEYNQIHDEQDIIDEDLDDGFNWHRINYKDDMNEL